MELSDYLNQLSAEDCRSELEKCCVAKNWIEGMMAARPFASPLAVHQSAERIWNSLTPADWKEAFTGHPKIGDLDSLRQKYAQTKALATGEQAGVATAGEETLLALQTGNQEYEDKFGYIFIVCATGKSADEMLNILQSRLPNEPDVELPIAANEQLKITLLRFEKLEKASA